jgi:hypothetical protein
MAFRSLTFTPALPKSAERANAVLNADKHKIRGDRINLSPLIYAWRDSSWISSTLTEFCFRYFVPVNKICSLSEFRFAQYVRKSAELAEASLTTSILPLKKATQGGFS